MKSPDDHRLEDVAGQLLTASYGGKQSIGDRESALDQLCADREDEKDGADGRVDVPDDREAVGEKILSAAFGPSRVLGDRESILDALIGVGEVEHELYAAGGRIFKTAYAFESKRADVLAALEAEGTGLSARSPVTLPFQAPGLGSKSNASLPSAVGGPRRYFRQGVALIGSTAVAVLAILAVGRVLDEERSAEMNASGPELVHGSTISLRVSLSPTPVRHDLIRSDGGSTSNVQESAARPILRVDGGVTPRRDVNPNTRRQIVPRENVIRGTADFGTGDSTGGEGQVDQSARPIRVTAGSWTGTRDVGRVMAAANRDEGSFLNSVWICSRDNGLYGDAMFSGTLTVRFTLNGNGRVASASARGFEGYPSFGSCVIDRLRAHDFHLQDVDGGEGTYGSYSFAIRLVDESLAAQPPREQ